MAFAYIFPGDQSNDVGHFVIACYFTNWAQYRGGNGKYTVMDIDPYLCTDLVYAFAGIDTAALTLKTIEWNDIGMSIIIH